MKMTTTADRMKDHTAADITKEIDALEAAHKEEIKYLRAVYRLTLTREGRVPTEEPGQ